jgi:hypothetical protein
MFLRGMNKIVLIGVWLLGGIPSVQAITTLHILNPPLAPGQVAEVEIRLENPQNVAGVQGTLLYDPALIQPIDPMSGGVEFKGGILEGFGAVNYRLDSPVLGKGAISFALAGTRGTSTSGHLMTLQFKVADVLPPNATAGVVPDFAHLSGNTALSSNLSEPMPFYIQVDNGVPFPVFLDLNGNGITDLSDVRLILKALVGLIQLTPEQTVRADLNFNGRIEVEDVHLLLRQLLTSF